MKTILKNWKTSLFGLGGFITGVATMFKGDVYGGITAILVSIGLVTAKDNDVL